MKPEKGEIRFYREEQETAQLSMGYLPQYNAIDKKFPISVEEAILSGLNIKKSLIGRFTAEQKEKVQHIISQMGLDGLNKRAIGQLSGGQLQRTLLGRALVSDPEIVILDEPNTYIDKRFETALYKILDEINSRCAIAIVSHDIGTILQQVKSVACVNETLDYHDNTRLAAIYLNLGEIGLNSNRNFSETSHYLLEAISLAKASDTNIIKDSYSTLSYLCESHNKWQQAVYYAQKGISMASDNIDKARFNLIIGHESWRKV